MKYSLARNGQVLGSYTLDELRAHLQTGHVLPTDYVLPEGGTQWVTLSQVLPETASPTPTNVTPPVAPPTAPAKPNNYLVYSILVTLLCCLPLGIVAIIYSTQVDSKYAKGDYAGAAAAAKQAALFCWISLGIGIVAGVLWGIATALGAMQNMP
jgi:hypothetical protein